MYQQEILVKGPKLTPAEQARLFRQLGDVHRDMGYIEFAYNNYKNAIAIDPEDLHSTTQMGLLLMTTHEFDNALETFKDIQKHRPADEKIRIYIAFAYYFYNEIDDAQKALADIQSDKYPELKNLLKTLIEYKQKKPMPDLLKILQKDQ